MIENIRHLIGEISFAKLYLHVFIQTHSIKFAVPGHSQEGCWVPKVPLDRV